MLNLKLSLVRRNVYCSFHLTERINYVKNIIQRISRRTQWFLDYIIQKKKTLYLAAWLGGMERSLGINFIDALQKIRPIRKGLGLLNKSKCE